MTQSQPEVLLIDTGDGHEVKVGEMIHGHCMEGHCLPDVEVLAIYPSLRRVLVKDIDGERVCLGDGSLSCVFLTPAELAEAEKAKAMLREGLTHPTRWKH